jgi:hypothetical protein
MDLLIFEDPRLSFIDFPSRFESVRMNERRRRLHNSLYRYDL